jgi:hypothetical protein
VVDLNQIVGATKRLEALLEQKFGATGRGLHEKLSSVESRIPMDLRKKIRYLATIRNKAVHEDGYEPESMETYLATAREATEALEAVEPPKPGKTPSQPGGFSLRHMVAAFLFGVGLMACWNMLHTGSDRAGETSAQALVAAASAQDPVEPKNESPTRAVQSTTQSAHRVTRAADETTSEQSADNIALSSSALTISAIRISYKNRANPSIKVTAHNNSDRTIAYADLEAALYINGETTPVFVSSKGFGSNLFLFFGDTGLPPGATETQSINPDTFMDGRWIMPDVLNAKKRIITIRVARTYDGRKQQFGDAAPPIN